MEKSIELGAKNVAYTLRVSGRARRMRLAVYCDGTVVAIAPFGMRSSVVEGFVASKTRWVLGKLEYFKKFPGRTFIKGDSRDFVRHKGRALALAQERVAHFNVRYGFVYRAITIRNQKTRWGSCSKKGNLNFNYKIALLPLRLADYIIVHELCHLGEFNHSMRFWSLVAKAMPDYAQMRDELKKSGTIV